MIQDLSHRSQTESGIISAALSAALADWRDLGCPRWGRNGNMGGLPECIARWRRKGNSDWLVAYKAKWFVDAERRERAEGGAS